MNRGRLGVLVGFLLIACGGNKPPAPLVVDPPPLVVDPAPPTPASEPPSPGAQMNKNPENGATSPTGEAHPGTVVTDDKIRGTQKEQAAADLPPTIAWVQNDTGGWTAVTRIEVTGTPTQMRITKFGADGAMLNSTTMSPPPR